MKIVYEVMDLLQKSQSDLRELIETKVSPRIKGNGYFIYSKNNKPKPMLCVHLDTINTHSKPHEISIDKDFEYDKNLNMIALSNSSRLDCLGGDDRAGVWIALELIDYMETSGDFKYDIAFFEDEEIGCKGSYELKDMLIHDVIDVNTTCYIGLDRRSNGGTQEVALYGTDNKELTELFVSLGYSEEMGSITDAAVLADDVACCNLSVGYDNEHSKNEVLYLDCMVDTLENLKKLEFPDTIYQSEYETYLDDIYSYNNDSEQVSWYVEELEMENEVLRDYLKSIGVDVHTVLTDGGIYRGGIYD